MVDMYCIKNLESKKEKRDMEKKNLLFMGDSITAGVYSDGKLNYLRESYDDMIVNYYKEKDILGTHYNIAVSGFTTSDMLEMLQSDLTYNENIAYNITPEKTYRKANYKKENTAKLLKEDIKISTLIKDADEIIMTIGSNDFVKYFDTHFDSTLEKLELKKIVSKDVDDSLNSVILDGVVKNYYEILTYIYSLNSDVKVVLIGAYTPTSNLIINKFFSKSLGRLEEGLFNRVKKKFQDVEILTIRNDIAKDNDLYLPNPLNIHLSHEGYEVIFKKYISKFFNK